MVGSRTSPRWAWTGPLFAVVFFFAVFALGGDTPGEEDSPQQIMDFYNSHQGRSIALVFLTPAVCALLLLFVGTLRSMAVERGVRPGPGPTVLAGGAILWASGLLIGSVFELTVITASDHGQGQVAQTANVLNNDAWIPFIAGVAITLIGAGLTVLGSDVLPRWLGWVALAAGVISLLGPGGFLGFWLAPLWLLVSGVMLSRSSTATAPAETLTPSPAR